jgi:nucleotide-binding universal stress UspA family protein
MDYKTILVHLDRSPRRSERMEFAFALAERHDAHLVGVFALSPVHVPSYALAEGASAVITEQNRQRAQTAREAEAAFRAATARYAGVKAEWRASEADALDTVRTSARYADLVIVGQRESHFDAGLVPEFVDELVLSAGRPVLVVPYAGHFPSVGTRAMVAWNGSAEAARAASDALPLLARAQSVDTVVFETRRSGGGEAEDPGADAALWLARHGVKARASKYYSPGVDIGSQILSHAADTSADLIVMGAYGHSRIRELVLGGATRTILESMTAPVLMSR